MKNESDEINIGVREQERGQMIKQTPKIDMIAKGVATGVVVSTIVQTGRGVARTLVKNPLIMFGLGFATGYFAHKYRKEIISMTHKTAEQSKDFIVRQKEAISDMLAENQEQLEKPYDSN